VHLEEFQRPARLAVALRLSVRPDVRPARDVCPQEIQSVVHRRLERKQAQQSRLVGRAEMADRDDLEPYLFQMATRQQLLLVQRRLRREKLELRPAKPQFAPGKPSDLRLRQVLRGRQQRQ
jgi:hypothetical protein